MEWGPDEVVVAGGEIRWDDFGLTPAGTPVISGTFDSPVTVPLDVPVGEPQTVHATGEAVVGDPMNPVLEITVDHDLDYTLVEEDVTADTPMGPVSGCKRYTGSTVVEGVTYEGEIVFHPTHGLVGGWVNWPDPDGARVDLRDIVDLGTGAFGDNELQGMALVGPDNPNFELNTYDVNGTLDADKDQHAKMLLELRYADEAMAMSDTQPPLNVEFGTAWGYFPHTLIPSPVSVFPPGGERQGLHLLDGLRGSGREKSGGERHRLSNLRLQPGLQHPSRSCDRPHLLPPLYTLSAASHPAEIGSRSR